jgi:hypothetical protein
MYEKKVDTIFWGIEEIASAHMAAAVVAAAAAALPPLRWQ